MGCGVGVLPYSHAVFELTWLSLPVQAMGIEEEIARENAKRFCGKKGMSLPKFAEIFTELACRDMRKFYFIERSYGLAGAPPRPVTRTTLDSQTGARLERATVHS